MAALGLQPDIALVDGNRRPPLGMPVQTIVGGDGLSASIAAASILAKVTRDRWMEELDGQLSPIRLRGPQGLRHQAPLCRADRVRPLSHPPPELFEEVLWREVA